jgi:hypothetical protein
VDDDIWQLSLKFFFPANELRNGDRWCNGLGELDDFARFVRSHAAYAATVPAMPLRVELDSSVKASRHKSLGRTLPRR